MEIFEREDPEYIEYVCLKVPEVCIIKISVVVIHVKYLMRNLEIRNKFTDLLNIFPSTLMSQISRSNVS